MKTALRILVIGLSLFVANSGRAIVGYYNYNFLPGDNFFQNNLSSGGNLLSTVMNPTTPAGTVISLWDPLTLNFSSSSVWDGVAWSSDFSLPPGTGAKLTAPLSFNNTFVGEVVTRDGSPFVPDLPFAYPPQFSGPNGVYLLGDKIPMSGANVFMRVFGRNPYEDEKVMFADGSIFRFSSLSGTGWVNGLGNEVAEPLLLVGQAALFDIGPIGFTYVVPEPSTTALGLLGLALVIARRRA